MLGTIHRRQLAPNAVSTCSEKKGMGEAGGEADDEIVSLLAALPMQRGRQQAVHALDHALEDAKCHGEPQPRLRHPDTQATESVLVVQDTFIDESLLHRELALQGLDVRFLLGGLDQVDAPARHSFAASS